MAIENEFPTQIEEYDEEYALYHHDNDYDTRFEQWGYAVLGIISATFDEEYL